MDSSMSTEKDVEATPLGDCLTSNTTISTFSWSSASVHVKDGKSKQPKPILDKAWGAAKAGELFALMGPSGSGKTTLLNLLSRRIVTSSAEVSAKLLVDQSEESLHTFRRISAYVEQEDALIGSLTVRQTLTFAAKLSLPSHVSSRQRRRLVESLIKAFGLESTASTIVGTPIAKGISGGQKRRLSIACQMVASPKILFLDEPTSGLDSTASYEVISFIKQMATKYNLLVIASIHQPSTKTFNLFDKVMLLSQGKTIYQGPVTSLGDYLGPIGFPIPQHMNPAEFMLDLVNTDFSDNSMAGEPQLIKLQEAWQNSQEHHRIHKYVKALQTNTEPPRLNVVEDSDTKSPIELLLILMHRSLIKSFRDLTVYGIRILMYTGLAIMMGTIWLRLDTTQENIQPFINAIFFGSAFMSFMAVAYVPAFLEDRAAFIKERANGLYGATLFQASNFFVGLPWLFVMSLLFSCITYWLINLRPSATAFFTWVMWVFLDLVAAESLVVLMSSLVPNFVIALAMTAFANGLWMSVGGFLVSPNILNVFWRYVFHYIDYQSYVFQGMMVNEFAPRVYSCAAGCMCSFPSDLASQCQISGKAVLQQYGYATGRTGKWVGILIGIVAVYRVLALGVTWLRKT